MANHAGKEGSVKIGANAVAEITDWSIDENAATIDNSELADDWETHLTGRKSWSGNLSCHWDETDTTGQGALTIGASVTLNVYPEGATTGDTFYSGTATVTKINRKTQIDAMISASFEFKGNGALTESTVS